MEMNASCKSFIKLFEGYGFTVTPMPMNSFIADNGTYCVFATAFCHYGNYELTAVSFLSCSRENIEKSCKNSIVGIGCEVYTRWSNNHLNEVSYGPIGNHDHSTFEIEYALKRMTGRN